MITLQFVKDLNSKISQKRHRRTGLFVKRMEFLENNIEDCSEEKENEVREKEREFFQEMKELTEDINMLCIVEEYIMSTCEIWDIEV